MIEFEFEMIYFDQAGAGLRSVTDRYLTYRNLRFRYSANISDETVTSPANAHILCYQTCASGKFPEI